MDRVQDAFNQPVEHSHVGNNFVTLRRISYQWSLSLDEAVVEVSLWAVFRCQKAVVLIEICHDSASELSGNWNFGRDFVLVVRATKHDDFTRRSTVGEVILCMRRCHGYMHYSSECTAGCPFKYRYQVGTREQRYSEYDLGTLEDS